MKDRWFYEQIPVVSGSPFVPARTLPDNLGPTKAIDSEDMDRIENDEHGACELHGTLFNDGDWLVHGYWMGSRMRASSGLLLTIIVFFKFSV